MDYDSPVESRLGRTVELEGSSAAGFEASKPVVSFIGAGNYASRMLIPAFKEAEAQLNCIVTSSGTSGVIHGEKGGFREASTDLDAMLASEATNTVAIVTRHNTHANFTVKALKAGKHVFVEKPLALTFDELDEVKQHYEAAKTAEKGTPHLMIGFNRRFSPQVEKMKSLLSGVKEPLSFIFTMNAGAIPADHWTQDSTVGGGRIIGEACHYIDLMRFFAQSEITSVHAHSMGKTQSVDVIEDKAVITLGFANGSFGAIHYLANGHASFPKERIEIFAEGKVLQLDNFIKLRGVIPPKNNRIFE